LLEPKQLLEQPFHHALAARLLYFFAGSKPMTHLSRLRCDSNHASGAQSSYTIPPGKKDLHQEGVSVREIGVRILVVEDYASWSRFICSTLGQKQKLRVVCVVSDGLDAVEKAKQLAPDLIMLDIGLPQLDGIQAARQILAFAPQSRIIFVSENRDPDIVEEALTTGARGYVLKSQAASDLLVAVEAVLAGGTFVSEHISL
jgi:CheY-like chemotaxis protein